MTKIGEKNTFSLILIKGDFMAKFANVTYGTKGDTALYTYLVNDTVNAGDIIQPSVKHHDSGKIFGTTAIVQNTAKEMSVKGKQIQRVLSGKQVGAERARVNGRFVGTPSPKPTKNAETGMYEVAGKYNVSQYAQQTRAGNVKARETYDEYASKYNNGERK
jgi:hypothetical protein